MWENMTAIKQGILRRWDSFPSQVKICCIKFVQRVVQVQTHGPIADPRVRTQDPVRGVLCDLKVNGCSFLA